MSRQVRELAALEKARQELQEMPTGTQDELLAMATEHDRIEDWEDRIWQRGKYRPEEVRRRAQNETRVRNRVRVAETRMDRAQNKLGNAKGQAEANPKSEYWQKMHSTKKAELKSARAELRAAQKELAELDVVD